MSAFVGFVTGFAKGAKERIEKEREDEEALISNRLKMAAANKIKREKETDAQKALLTSRYEKVLPYVAGLSEQQILGLVSNDEIATQFYNRASKGETVDVNTFLKINEDKIPQNFTTVKNLIAQISAAPAPVDSKTIDSLTDTEGFFGARLMTPGRLQKTAQQFGGSAEELLAYEQPQEIEQLDNIARINVDMLRPKKDGDDRLKDAEIAVFDAIDQFGKDSPEVKLAASNYAAIKAVQAELDPTSATFAKMLDRAKMDVANAAPADKKATQDALDYLLSIDQRGKAKDVDPNKLTLPQQRSLLNAVTTNALAAQYPRYKDDIARQTDPITGDVTLVAISSNEQVTAELRNTQLAALKGMYDEYYSTPDGLPKDQQTKQLLSSMGVQFDESGRPIFKVGVPAPAPDPNRPSRVDTPAPARTPAAAAAPDGRGGRGVVRNTASAPAAPTTPAAPAAAAGDTYRFENLDPSQVEAVVKASGTGEGLNTEGVRRLLTNKDDFNAQPLEQRKRWFAAMNKIAPSSAPANAPNFRSVEEAEAANLPKGTRITINGRRAEVQ
jgi:hypothetical protein